MGRNGLFLHREWGARVRLGTLFTDWAGCEQLVGGSRTHTASAIPMLQSVAIAASAPRPVLPARSARAELTWRSAVHG